MIFEYLDYKKYVVERISSMANNGRGEYRALANALRIHTTLVSQIFKGPRDLNQEQALALCSYWGLSELETKMFMSLVDYSRAGNSELKKFHLEKIDEIKISAQKLKKRLSSHKSLSEEAMTRFYSNWYYSGIRMLTSTREEGLSLDEISEATGMPRKLVRSILDFLIYYQLCVQNGDRFLIGEKKTHIPDDHPMISKHHINWRLKGFNKGQDLKENELMFTSPLSISVEDSKAVRKDILSLVDSISKRVDKTQPEKVFCLNIDWFDVF